MQGIEFAEKECFNNPASKDPTQHTDDWIFMLPHENIDKDFFKSWIDKYNIKALIIVSDTLMDSTYIFLKPQYISVIDTYKARDLLTLLTANTTAGHMRIMIAKLEHDYITNCPVVQALYMRTMLYTCGIYAVISLVWGWILFYKHQYNSN